MNCFFLGFSTMNIGLIFGYQASISITFLDEGMDLKLKTILNLLALPFQFLPLYGLLIDMNFIKKIGKTKTYHAISPLIYIPLLFFISFYIDEWIEKLWIWGFFACYLVIMIVQAMNLIALDAWIARLFDEEKRGLGSYSRFFGLGNNKTFFLND